MTSLEGSPLDPSITRLSSCLRVAKEEIAILDLDFKLSPLHARHVTGIGSSAAPSSVHLSTYSGVCLCCWD